MARIKQKINSILTRLAVINKKQLGFRVAAVLLGFMAAHAVHATWPKSINFSFVANHCFSNPVFLPNLHRFSGSQSYDIQPDAARLSILGYPILSSRVCVSPHSAPAENTAESAALHFWGAAFLKQSIQINTDQYPNLIANDDRNEQNKISTKATLSFALDKQDKIFDYHLVSTEKHAACQKPDNKPDILCSAEKLELSQGEKYKLRLERRFEAEPIDTLLEKNIITLDPVEVKKSSIKPGSVVYGKPQSITLNFNKTISAVEAVKLQQATGEQKGQINHQASVDKNQLKINYDQELPREEKYILTVGSVTAADNSFLDKPLVLEFETSGGPKINSVNIGSYGVNLRPRITVTFDQPVSEETMRSELFIETGGDRVDAFVSKQGRTISITPTESFSRCTNFSIRAGSNLSSEHGIKRGYQWQHDSRTVCQLVSTIGRSVNGRAIQAYRFGSGSGKIIFVGGMHGNEQSSKYVLDSLINDLERNAPNIPSNRTVIVIPNVNPDAVASGSRFNAKGVDLNRNFPTSNWKKDVVVPGGSTAKGAGGKSPLSEPESRALADYILANRPRLLLTYHAHASVVLSNDSGGSRSYAKTYGQKAGYRYGYAPQTCQFFSYCDTTGELENWLHEKQGIPALLVELSTTYLNEYSRNRDAIWTMINN